MAEEEPVTVMGPRELGKYAVSFDRLHNHLNEGNPSVKKTVEVLESLEGLKNIKEFTDIGQQVSDWRESLLKSHDFTGPLGVMSLNLNSEVHEDLKTATQSWRTRFYDRVEEKLVVATPETDLPIGKLIEGPTSFMNLQGYEGYESEIRDLYEACASILVSSYTSAEFMALRAVEGVLRKWHKEEVNEEEDYSGWAAAIQDISDSDDGNGPKELRLLDYLRERRNEVAHPDRHSTIRDAENTLRQAMDVVETLILELELED